MDSYKKEIPADRNDDDSDKCVCFRSGLTSMKPISPLSSLREVVYENNTGFEFGWVLRKLQEFYSIVIVILLLCGGLTGDECLYLLNYATSSGLIACSNFLLH